MGGTRFFGIGTVRRLVEDGHNVTVATRGLTPDSFGDSVERITFDHRYAESIHSAFEGRHYDAVIDKIAFSSNDVKRVAENVSFDRYILMSTCGVYGDRRGLSIGEECFDPYSYGIVWGERRWGNDTAGDFDYDEGKRQAESAAALLLPEKKCVMVRYPVVMGRGDYTKRLRFYIEHTLSGKPMYISNLTKKVTYMYAEEAASLFADLLGTDVSGPLNGCCDGYLTIEDILRYTEKQTGKKAVISSEGAPAPYNGFADDTLYSNEKAKRSGIVFSEHKSWIYGLIDHYIEELEKENI